MSQLKRIVEEIEANGHSLRRLHSRLTMLEDKLIRLATQVDILSQMTADDIDDDSWWKTGGKPPADRGDL